MQTIRPVERQWLLLAACLGLLVTTHAASLDTLLLAGLVFPWWATRFAAPPRPWAIAIWAGWALCAVGLAMRGEAGEAGVVGSLVLTSAGVQQALSSDPVLGICALVLPVCVGAVHFHDRDVLLALWLLYPWWLSRGSQSPRGVVVGSWLLWGTAVGLLLADRQSAELVVLATVVLATRRVQRQLDATDVPWLPVAAMGLASLAGLAAGVPQPELLLLFWVLLPLWRPGYIPENLWLLIAWVACLGAMTWQGHGLLALVSASVVLSGRGLQRQLELGAARRDFTSMVSHELRTPIAAMRLHAEMLEHDLVDDPAEIRNCYRALGEQARRLEHLTETILDLSRLERGARKFERASGTLNEVVHEAVERLGASGPDDLALDLKQELPACWLDREAATQVLVNLLTNGKRYAREVSVATDFDARWVYARVLDRGPGLSPTARARLFEPYARGSDQGKGLGLGLALVKGYMEGQGGRITVRDRPGGGCIFETRFRRC